MALLMLLACGDTGAETRAGMAERPEPPPPPATAPTTSPSAFLGPKLSVARQVRVWGLPYANTYAALVSATPGEAREEVIELEMDPYIDPPGGDDRTDFVHLTWRGTTWEGWRGGDVELLEANFLDPARPRLRIGTTDLGSDSSPDDVLAALGLADPSAAPTVHLAKDGSPFIWFRPEGDGNQMKFRFQAGRLAAFEFWDENT